MAVSRFFIFSLALFAVYQTCFCEEDILVHRAKRQFSFKQAAPCLRVKGFYRNPSRPKNSVQELLADCRSFYSCVQGTVFKMQCPPDTFFDVVNQNCPAISAMAADNCAVDSKDKFVQATTPQPQFNNTNCKSEEFACANGACLAKEFFCDNSRDCADFSDELVCGIDEDPMRAPRCNVKDCKLPDCYCSADGKAIPGGLSASQVPQMVILQFDDSINDNNIPIYDTIFTPNRTNGNGCPIRGTFFPSHVFNNYQYMEKLAKGGHEIAIKGIDTDRNETVWNRPTEEFLTREYITARRIFSKFARLPEQTFQGMRMQFLKGAGNAQFNLMNQNGIRWDSSLSVEPLDVPVWPYTLDYRIPHKCYPEKSAQCPARSFPRLWELPLNQLKGTLDETCSILPQCNRAETSDDMVQMLEDNLNHFYTTNRAPFTVAVNTNWFVPEHFDALLRWIDNTLRNRTDVYFVTASQAISWIQNPTPLSNIQNFAPWQCPARSQTPACEEPNGCNLESADDNHKAGYMITCERCPSFYPDFDIPDGEALEI